MSRLSPAVLAARETLAAGRDKLRRQHDAGSPGVQVCARWTDLLEGVVVQLFREALAELSESDRAAAEPGLAVVAHSGFGRREMAPYSDIDVMLLHARQARDRGSQAVRRFSQNLYDTGMDIGFAARTPEEACSLAMSDATVLTSLVEGRQIAGDTDLYAAFDGRFRRMTKRRWRRLLAAVEQARREERRKFGETVFLLEPNVKRTRGGLRDLQLIRWIGFIRYGEGDVDGLAQAGRLTKEEQQQLRQARDFLLWLRNDLHFTASAATDVLDRTEQLRITELRNYPQVAGLLPVEQFMREYFQHTSRVREIAGHLAEGARPVALSRWLFDGLFTHRFEGEFRVGPATIAVTPKGLEQLQGDLAEVLRLLDLANRTDKRIAYPTWQAIRTSMQERGPADPNQPLPRAASERFLSLMSQPARLGELLRKLHELRVLEQLVPGMTHARGLLQFNAYHRYTVDEHSIRVVEHLASLASDPGRPGEVYRGLQNKELLHLAALLHDLGKGYPQDHSEVGATLAAQTASRLGLPPHDAELLQFLVLKHLRMSHLAQQHDITDDQVVVQFAVEVGSPEVLKMLYVLTIADLAAVGPGVLNEWKQQLLTDLYDHTLRLLSSDSPADAASARQRQRREEVLSLARKHEGQGWWETQILSLPSSVLFSGPPAQIVEELDRIRTHSRLDAQAWGRHLPARNVVEYTVGTYEEIAPGIFHRLTGALTSLRQQIFSADINTLAEGVVLDRFWVRDQDFSGPPPAERLDEVCAALVSALKDHSGKPPVFRKVWGQKPTAQQSAIQHLPTRVTFDNTTAERFTIVATFAYDRMGLLYAIARTLFELGLSVSKAKIGTHLDQVVDVFYVSDQHTGRKIDDEVRLAEIRRR
ncbi:MAG TPA: [protein-PII] uridylyltransferase, partial [Pirellulaceae bacterium]|nr:[protein-PII] uridylyltransferase [Pirellulaceae bacterium]